VRCAWSAAQTSSTIKRAGAASGAYGRRWGAVLIDGNARTSHEATPRRTATKLPELATTQRSTVTGPPGTKSTSDQREREANQREREANQWDRELLARVAGTDIAQAAIKVLLERADQRDQHAWPATGPPTNAAQPPWPIPTTPN